jgi:hypothetical protein
MKKLLLSIIVLFSIQLSVAQAPYKFNYQGSARNNSGIAIASQTIALRISILDKTSSGTVVYSETQSPVTNAFGLYNVAIGNGTPVSGSLTAVNWSDGDKYMKVEMDPAGGTAYVNLGTSQLLSVPYAVRSEDAGRVMIYGSGYINANKMVIQHSPAYPNWGLQYCDTTDKFRFLTNGFNMLEVNLGAQKTIVNGALQVTSGAPGVDKVLTSDATGNASWQNFSTQVSAFQPTGCQSLGTVTATYQKIGDMGTFTKNVANTLIELNVQTNLNMATFVGNGGVVYELRVDGVATSIGNATVLLRTAGTYEPVTITGVFNNLSAGSHTVSLWAKAANGTGTSVMWDAGCFNGAGTNNVLVKEFK